MVCDRIKIVIIDYRNLDFITANEVNLRNVVYFINRVIVDLFSIKCIIII